MGKKYVIGSLTREQLSNSSFMHALYQSHSVNAHANMYYVSRELCEKWFGTKALNFMFDASIGLNCRYTVWSDQYKDLFIDAYGYKLLRAFRGWEIYKEMQKNGGIKER